MTKHNIKKSNTCIAMCKNKQGKLMIAGDRRASWGFHMAQAMPKPKISKRDGMLLGATGDGSLCSLLVDVIKYPKLGNKDLDQYMYKEFFEAVYLALIRQGYGEEHSLLRIPSDVFCELVIGIEGHVFTITVCNVEEGKSDSLGSVILIDEVGIPYATGCGGIPALSVLKYEYLKKKYITKEDMRLALCIAADISPGCDDNIDILVED